MWFLWFTLIGLQGAFYGRVPSPWLSPAGHVVSFLRFFFRGLSAAEIEFQLTISDSPPDAPLVVHPQPHLLLLSSSFLATHSHGIARKMGKDYLLQCSLDLLKVGCIFARTTEGTGCLVDMPPAPLSLSKCSIFLPKQGPSKSIRLLSTQVTSWRMRCQYCLLASVPYI